MSCSTESPLRKRLTCTVADGLTSVELMFIRAVKRTFGIYPAQSCDLPLGRGVALGMGRGDLTDAEWEQLRPFLPVGNGRCGRWRDHRPVIDGILHRVRTGVQWRDLPERFGPWKTVYERHRLWSADGTWERLLQQVQAAADAAAEIDWDISLDSTIVRAHQHAAGARTHPPSAPASKGAEAAEHQDETAWQSLHARLAEVVRKAKVWAARAAGSPPSST